MPDRSDLEDVVFEQPSEAQCEAYIKEMGTDRETVNRETQELKSWLATHQILPTVDDEKFLERFHAHCKFDIEKTKRKLELYYRTRTFEPEFMLNRDPLDPAIIGIKDIAYHITLPLLTPKGQRVSILKIFDGDADKFDPDLMLKSSMMMLDSHINEDLCKEHVIIIDADKFTPHHLLKMNLNFLKRADTCSTKAYPHRYANIHFLNIMQYMHATLNIYKMLMGSKMTARIVVHPNYSSLHEYIPKHILPVDYEGTYKYNLDELKEVTYRHMLRKTEWFEQQKTIFADLKTCNDSFQDVFGSKGTFKTIQID